MELLRRGKSLFQFYDDCARNGYDELRSIVNGWLAEMPEPERGELITRMQNGGDREFGTALCELAVHAFLLRSGCKVLVHPQVPGSSKRPDFAATDQGGNPLAYVEVTTVNPPAAQDAEANRENPVYNAINVAKLPAGSCLGYRLVRPGKNSPGIAPACRADRTMGGRQRRNGEEGRGEQQVHCRRLGNRARLVCRWRELRFRNRARSQ
jgi:hypothetical protein